MVPPFIFQKNEKTYCYYTFFHLLWRFHLLCARYYKRTQRRKDGFKWYQLKQDKYFGASDINGKIIIPLNKKYVSLYYSFLDNTDRGFFNVRDENNYWGLVEKRGKEIISTDRGYDLIVYQITDKGYKYFDVHKDYAGKQGVCDLTGKELISPQLCDAIIYSDDNFKILEENGSWNNTGITLSKKDPLSNNKSFKQMETEEKGGFKWYRVHKGDYIGAESVDGKQLIPAKYESVEYKCNNYRSNDLPYFEVKKKEAIGVYDLTGKILIPIERNYDDIRYESSDEHPYFLVKKNNKKGACDLSGKEVISPIYYYVFLSNYGFSTKLSENAEEKQTDIKINSKGFLVDNANPTDANHQYNLGVDFFTNGNLQEAIKWIKKSAAQGYVDAEYFLGLCYENGNGTTKNLTEAISWYKKAQNHGHPDAAKRIAELTKPVTPPQTYTAQTQTTKPQTQTSTTPKSVAPRNTAPRNDVAYLDVLRQYEGRSRVPDLGPYVRSERDEHSTQVIYRFYNEKGWQKYVAIGKCLYCHGTGKCSGFHFGFCSLCGNSGKCRYCGGNGTSLTIAAYGPTGYYSEDGVFHSSNSGGGSNVSVPNSGGGYSGGSSNSRSSSSSVYTKCNSCNGTGVCQHCHGKSGEWTDIGTYTGTNTKTWSNCVSCNGSGKCSICYGRGKL